MMAYNPYISRTLQKAEHDQLLAKGYFKLKLELSLEHVQIFKKEVRVGDKFIFHSPSEQDVPTTVTSIDIGQGHDDVYKIFIGFTLN
jgi:hypothetical protein